MMPENIDSAATRGDLVVRGEGPAIRTLFRNNGLPVKEPANKKCRIVEFAVEGGKRNRMTWRVEPGSIGQDPDPDRKGLMVSGVTWTHRTSEPNDGRSEW